MSAPSTPRAGELPAESAATRYQLILANYWRYQLLAGPARQEPAACWLIWRLLAGSVHVAIDSSGCRARPAKRAGSLLADSTDRRQIWQPVGFHQRRLFKASRRRTRRRCGHRYRPSPGPARREPAAPRPAGGGLRRGRFRRRRGCTWRGRRGCLWRWTRGRRCCPARRSGSTRTRAARWACARERARARVRSFVLVCIRA